MSSIFTELSMDRSVSKWEFSLLIPTPFEKHDGVWFKREDYFAPLGYGGINGSKLRQLIWVMNRGRDDAIRVLSGASVKSPQLSMSTVVARHYGLPTELIIGATKPDTATKHPNVQIAARYGARFRIIPVAYNPALQRALQDLARSDDLVVEYGITLDHKTYPANQVQAFHEVGARQVTNLPEEVDTLIVPAGSCNSLVSILLGLSSTETNIRTLRTYGIGPNKMPWVHDRLKVLGIDPEHFPFAWEHRNLQTEGFCDYQMEMKESWGDIVFHPTYEGKIIRWLKLNRPFKKDGTEAFWIVGSKPDPEVMARFAPLPYQELLTCL